MGKGLKPSAQYFLIQQMSEIFFLCENFQFGSYAIRAQYTNKFKKECNLFFVEFENIKLKEYM